MPSPPFDRPLDHLYRPAQTDNKPSAVLFLLHGYGSNKEDLFSFSNYLPPHFAVIALNAPIALPFGGYAWYELEFTADMKRLSNYEQAHSSLKRLKENIEHYCDQYQLDKSQVSCLGFSQGAILSWALGLDAPKQIQQIIGLSGLIDPELLLQPLDTYRDIVAFASHGREDATLPIDYARESIGTLSIKNPAISYKEYPTGHTISQENFNDMLQWLVRQRI
ncbi:MAG: alpha/beta hydrolase [Flavobacteriaceae bacterium]